MKTGLELEDRNEIRGVDQRLVFGPLRIVDRALVGPFCKGVDSFLDRQRYLEIPYATCGLCVQTAAERLQQAVEATRSAHTLTLAQRNAALN